MLKTSEAIIRPDGTIWFQNPIEIDSPCRLILIILEEVKEKKITPEETEALVKKIKELPMEKRMLGEDFIHFLCERHLRTWKVEGQAPKTTSEKIEKI